MFENEIESNNICGKRIFIFESHHFALYPWALLKREIFNSGINLFSFDYHTDTLNPFSKFSYNSEDMSINEKLQKELIKEMNFQDDSSLRNAITKLNHDEHILAAIQSGIIEHAFIISHLGSEKPLSYEEIERIDKCYTPEEIIQQVEGTYRITPREERHYPPSDIYMTDFLMSDYDDGNEVANILLDDKFLQQHISVMSRMSGIINLEGNIETPYILDIDLDYFTSKYSLFPHNMEIFSRLVKNAKIITIAKESVCVEICSGGNVDSEYLLEKLLLLLEKCLSKRD